MTTIENRIAEKATSTRNAESLKNMISYSIQKICNKTADFLDDDSRRLGKDTIEELTDRLCSTIIYGLSPYEHFDYVHCGAFKECYYLDGHHDYIVKFYSQFNNTTEEINSLSLAEECGVSRFFLPTAFIPFNGYCVPADHLCDEIYESGANEIYDEENDEYIIDEDFEYPEFIGLEIQPAISMTAGNDESDIYLYRPDHSSHYKPVINPATGEKVPDEVIGDIDIASRNWVAKAAFCYGNSALADLAKFVKDFQIKDLHSGNLGYIDGLPVIIDWFSHTAR